MTLPSFAEYMRRMIQYKQMDIAYTFAQMLDLCLDPRRVYQLTAYRKQTKNQWARDDPAFVVVLILFLSVSALSYGIALQLSASEILRVLAVFVGVHFLLIGAVVATFASYIADKHLRVRSYHGVEQRIEWMYAFDIHCNSFFPLVLILYVLHYFLLPFLVRPTLFAAIVGNCLYALAFSSYCYITSLGYSTLPFLKRTEVFLYPAAVVLSIIGLLTIFGVNLTQHSMLYLIDLEPE